jgi:hypothetical protein
MAFTLFQNLALAKLLLVVSIIPNGADLIIHR